MRAQEPITKDAIPALLESLGSPWGRQLELDLTRWKPINGELQPDYRVRVCWADQSYEFVAESKSRSTPKTIDQAVLQAQRFSEATGLLPMIIVPYLDERQLDRLADEGISGIDLSGNGIVIVPGRLLLRRSGRPNRYPDSQPTKYAYRGATSLVPRVFLCQREYSSVTAIKDEIEERGGSVALSTVSKALTRMLEDVVIERTDSRIALLQPDVILEKLSQNFQMPALRRTIGVKATEPIARFFKRANRDRDRPRLVLSGASSQDRYAAGIRSDERIAYCDNIEHLRLCVGRWEESERFAELRIAETSDRTLFFDARIDRSGIAYSSPIQAYLELSAGDKRDREMANDIRESILRDIQ